MMKLVMFWASDGNRKWGIAKVLPLLVVASGTWRVSHKVSCHLYPLGTLQRVQWAVRSKRPQYALAGGSANIRNQPMICRIDHRLIHSAALLIDSTLERYLEAFERPYRL